MTKDQIFYITGRNKEIAKRYPFAKCYQEKGYLPALEYPEEKRIVEHILCSEFPCRELGRLNFLQNKINSITDKKLKSGKYKQYA